MLGRSLSISTKIIFEWLLPYFDIIASMNSKKVSFISNHDTRCVPCTFGMGLAYFSPKLKFTMKELENFCGFKEGHGTWKAEAILGMARLGYEVYWIEQFDFNSFSNNPEAYLRSILSDEVYKEQASNTDLQLEAKRMKKYINSGLPLEYRQGTNDDIKDFLDDGWLVHLEVNARTLAGRSGYDGHSILVTGYNDDEVIIQNPDSDNGNQPNQHVSWQVLNLTL